jgi:rhodanese-related sulfurtransferase
MIRDRLRGIAKKAALKAFGMERQAEASDPPSQKLDAPPESIDASVIPKIVDGSGDTPGPNHRTDIGRTWLAAQVASGVAPLLIDLRHPKECVAGILPRAVLMPGETVRARLAEMPADKTQRIVVYDQISSEHATEVAAWLREQGWPMARRLAGGFAEWIEHAEPIEVPQPPAGGQWHIGVMVERRSGGRGWVQAASLVNGAPVYTLWMEDGTSVGGLGASDLRG